jgi:hypothetical protein
MSISPKKIIPSSQTASADSSLEYDIFTTGNNGYWPFLDAFLGSVEKHGHNCKNIYVGDTGVEEPYTESFNRPKVTRLFQEGLKATYDGTHQGGWKAAVNHKTTWLSMLLGATDDTRPLIMIDNDVLMLKDFSGMLRPEYDIQVTDMECRDERTKTRIHGYFERKDIPAPEEVGGALKVRSIASLVVFNNRQAAVPFVQDWMTTMREFRNNPKVRYPHETPALNYLLEMNKIAGEPMKVAHMKEEDVCVDRGLNKHDRVVPPLAYSVHFKSDGSNKNGPRYNFLSRILHVTLPDGSIYNPEDYLDKELYRKWVANNPQ